MEDDVSRLARYIQLTIGVLWMFLCGGCAMYFVWQLGSEAAAMVIISLFGVATGWMVARMGFRALVKAKND